MYCCWSKGVVWCMPRHFVIHHKVLPPSDTCYFMKNITGNSDNVLRWRSHYIAACKSSNRIFWGLRKLCILHHSTNSLQTEKSEHKPKNCQKDLHRAFSSADATSCPHGAVWFPTAPWSAVGDVHLPAFDCNTSTENCKHSTVTNGTVTQRQVQHDFTRCTSIHPLLQTRLAT